MAGVAEFPQKRHFVASNSADELLHPPVRRSVNIENATAAFLGGFEDGFRGDETDPTEDSIKFHERFRFI
jgi:hypothetical protein